MPRTSLVVVPILVAACGGAPAPKADDASNPSARRTDPEEPPPTDPGSDPLFVAASHICRLVDHKDDGLLAVSFVPEFFDTTPPVKIDAALSQVRTGLGPCGKHMIIVQRASPIEGVVAVECENGVLVLSLGLATSPHKPIVSLGLEPRPLTSLRDVAKPAPPK